jgi:hypothetical protein
LDKKKNNFLIIFIFPALFCIGVIFYSYNNVFAAGFAGVQATVKIAICGNNIKETGEQCDNADLGGSSCALQGFSGGTLSCRASCDFDTSACSSGGGGGGGGSYTPPAPVVQQASRCSNFPKSSDINNDGSVGIFDFNLLMVKWGSAGQNIAADINCDGVVDIFDFNLLMVNWGKILQ